MAYMTRPADSHLDKAIYEPNDAAHERKYFWSTGACHNAAALSLLLPLIPTPALFTIARSRSVEQVYSAGTGRVREEKTATADPGHLAPDPSPPPAVLKNASSTSFMPVHSPFGGIGSVLRYIIRNDATPNHHL